MSDRDNLLKRLPIFVGDQVVNALAVIPSIFNVGVIGAPVSLVAREVSEVGYLLTGERELSKINRLADGVSHERDFANACVEAVVDRMF